MAKLFYTEFQFIKNCLFPWIIFRRNDKKAILSVWEKLELARLKKRTLKKKFPITLPEKIRMGPTERHLEWSRRESRLVDQSDLTSPAKSF